MVVEAERCAAEDQLKRSRVDAINGCDAMAYQTKRQLEDLHPGNTKPSPR
jgi:hypothetical protein